MHQASLSATTLSEIAAHDTLTWMIYCCSHGMPSQGSYWPFISTRLPQGQDKPAWPCYCQRLACPAVDSWASFGICWLYDKVSSQADWLMTRPIKAAWRPEQWHLCEGIHWRPVPSRACLSAFKSFFFLSWSCGVLSPHAWQLKPLNPDNLSSDERRRETRHSPVLFRIHWLANETKITCKNVALFESGLGFHVGDS